ncbi:MAG TPA: MBL fold metallo-hydrolase [Candidatus Binataceae bacterium]|nr:MBL fold metallo-hydrolase [Candidatus Binataceae bacterium]
MAHGKWAFTKGLHDIGNGAFAYLQPDGSWGWSNAGLITDGGESMLVDTLFDLPLTRAMLHAMRPATAHAPIRKLVNSHSNGDHCNGNELVEGAEIIASKACADEMRSEPPGRLAAMMKAAPSMGPVGEYILKIFGPFQFEGIRGALPTRTFEGELEVTVGAKRVRLIQVGPAHTRGDLLVHVPADRTIFTGDILFIGGHPIIWAGPVANWIAACDTMLALDVETIVPGHGPITDKAGVAALKGYLEYIHREARKRFDAGIPAAEAARDIALDAYASWTDAERIVVNVATLYREFAPGSAAADITPLFAQMAAMAQK